jgi:hypothetical protein
LKPDIVHQPQRYSADGLRRHTVLEKFGDDFFAKYDVDDAVQAYLQKRLSDKPRCLRNPVHDDFGRAQQRRLQRRRPAGHDRRPRVSDGVVGVVGDDPDRARANDGFELAAVKSGGDRQHELRGNSAMIGLRGSSSYSSQNSCLDFVARTVSISG